MNRDTAFNNTHATLKFISYDKDLFKRITIMMCTSDVTK